MKTVTVNLYSFDELSEDARNRAISEHRDFLNSEDAEDEYAYEYTSEDAIDSILANAYFFFEDGTLAHCTTYTGKHEKAGITEFHFHGRDYVIETENQYV